MSREDSGGAEWTELSRGRSILIRVHAVHSVLQAIITLFLLNIQEIQGILGSSVPIISPRRIKLALQHLDLLPNNVCWVPGGRAES